MPSSSSFVYRSLEEIIAKNRKAVNLPCDFSRSSWVCGRNDVVVRKTNGEASNEVLIVSSSTITNPAVKNTDIGNFFNAKPTMKTADLQVATPFSPAPIKLATNNVTNNNLASIFNVNISRKSAGLQNNSSASGPSTGSYQGRKQVVIKKMSDPKMAVTDISITVKKVVELQKRSPIPQNIRPVKRSNGGQHSLDRFVHKKPKNDIPWKPQEVPLTRQEMEAMRLSQQHYSSKLFAYMFNILYSLSE
ncbi:hypothetical protein PRIPAC_94099 [Pristionchus pacificus]|uniref:Uncharacterized protein n=1 Tax=Pristionchus pacificus TaxID=54126 RepID=A0A454Y7E8_PRIPA|nr:hypothetical protein PRIPAC_94099 [Pristionchus pacificus]|eukprot:PDM68370.1 hypothetical protein PRIPAC_46414 [Pristionchus pacificus]